MLESLKFVQGAVAKKDFVPELTHFRIENNTIKGYNGTLALCSPIELDLEVTPRAIPFIKAIGSCRAATAMHITTSGRLSIKSGKFKAFIECVEQPYPDIKPEGDRIELDGSFINTLRKLAPFMAEDASRPWARGILLRGQSAFVTNNIVMVQAWLPDPFPVEVNIPASAVKELIRMKVEPIALQMNENSVTFHYPGGRWLRTQLTSLAWPEVDHILGIEGNPEKPPAELFKILEDLKPFVDEAGRIIIEDGRIKTSEDDDIGASVEIDDLIGTGIFNIKQFMLIEAIVEKIDLTLHPRPSLFYGEKLRGVIIGMRS